MKCTWPNKQTTIERRLSRLEAEVTALQEELLSTSNRLADLAEALNEEAHVAARILAAIEKTRLRPDQFH